MTNIRFTKMNGLGNDFIILDYEEYKKTNIQAAELAIRLCDRHFGVGADGLIIADPDSGKADISWIFHNSDGSAAEMCGNGIRCFARYVYDKKIIAKKEFAVATKAGTIVPQIISADTVRVNMGKPVLECGKIPCAAATNLNIPYDVDGNSFLLNAVGMGNPHCVIFVKDGGKKHAAKYGSAIENSPLFPEKTNVEFVEIVSRNEITVNVWERGCGITLACGTGACASVAAGVLNGYLDDNVKTNLPSGALSIEWSGGSADPARDIFMTGPAAYSFTGEIVI